MCLYCKDLDDYERRHGHKCDEDCEMSCDACGKDFCLEDEISLFDEIHYCSKECKIRADRENAIGI